MGWIVLIFVEWLAGSIMDIRRYLPHWTLEVVALGLLGIAIVILGLKWLQTRQLGWGYFAALWVFVAVLYVIVFPIAQRRSYRNDSDDALILACTQLLHHHFPYYERTFLGNPITPMPGALLLALPFQMLGRVSLQALFWIGLFIWFSISYFSFRSTAFAFLIVTILANAHTLVNILDGADYPVNWIYICIGTLLFLSYAERGFTWQFVLSGVFMGVALSSRPTYVLVIVPLIVAYLMQQVGAMIALRRIALPLFVMAVVTAPFYLYDPRHFSPFHVADRLSFLPEQLQHQVVLLLIVLTIATSCIGFFVRLTRSRLFLLAGIASAVLLVTPGVIWALRSDFSFDSLVLLSYSDASACFLSLWAFRCMEEQFAAVGVEGGTAYLGKGTPYLTCKEHL
jgi:hypothetical protein